MRSWIYKLRGDGREIAAALSQRRNSGKLIIRILVPSARPVEKNESLVILDDVRNVERRT